jgi:hypothetical protein
MSPIHDDAGDLRPIPFPPEPEDGYRSIAWRVTRITALLETYYQMHDGISRHEALNDLLSDLRHFGWWHEADARDAVEFDAALDSSFMNFCEEHWEENHSDDTDDDRIHYIGDAPLPPPRSEPPTEATR